MELETTPALKESIQLKGTLVSFEGTFEPMVFNVKYNIATSGTFDGIYGIAANAIQKYNDKFWVVNGYSDTGTPSFIENPVVFKTNFIGGWREILEQELRTVVREEFEARGIALSEMRMEIQELQVSKEEPYNHLLSINGKIFHVKMELVHEENYNPNCDTCQMGKHLIEQSMHDIKKNVIFFADAKKKNKYVFGDTKISLQEKHNVIVAHDDSKETNLAERFRQWFVLANAGAVEMARVTAINFS